MPPADAPITMQSLPGNCNLAAVFRTINTSYHSRMSSATAPGDLPASEFLVVGLGGSAGAIPSFREFFRHVPADSGMAYVVILHLSPEHESRLAEVLQGAAAIPVKQVRESEKVAPNHVYVIPPNKSLALRDGMLLVSDIAGFEERRAPVDIFFRTLADTHDARAVCVIVSGTGADGSTGLRRVKEYNGLVLVQDPSEAEFAEMPRNSIATGLVDFVMPVAAMPARIMTYRDQLRRMPHLAESQASDDEQALIEIFTHLRLRTGHDFTNYKRATVLRRLERRLAVREIISLPEYARYLRERADEADALLRELLISVTNFFRDRAVWDKVEEIVVPELLRGKGADDHVRVWVAGCATGEEAYSMAMLLADATAQLAYMPDVQIFATDIDERAVARARTGFYSVAETADVPPESLRRYFLKEPDGYRVRRELREMVLFAHHNLIKDPPFSHLDLVSCRNVLIYLNRTAQQRAMEVLQFALEPGGYLLLGTAESVDGAGPLFSTVDKEAHIYQSRAVPRAVIMQPPAQLTAVSDVRHSAATAEQRAEARVRFAPLDLHQRLLEEYAAPSVVVDEQYDIVHLTNRAGRYLQFAAGEGSLNLLQVVRPELRIDLRTALVQAAQKHTTVAARGVAVRTGERVETVNVIVRPALREGDPPRGFFLVLFEQTHESVEITREAPAAVEPAARQLEDELIRVKAQMRVTIEQYEVQAEEARAANEELQAMNEELRSTAEELETSQEELQSVNEELRTVNQELKVKIDEISHANNDLRNLMSSTEIGTIFVDRGMRVKLFTPRIRDIFNLIPADVGRPLADITHKLNGIDLAPDIERVLDRLQTIEREVSTRDGYSYLLRLLPYRTAEDRIDGVVLMFVDITARRKAENALQESRDRLEIALSTAHMAAWEWDPAGDRLLASAMAGEVFGLRPGETLRSRRQAFALVHPDDRERQHEVVQQACERGEGWHSELRIIRPRDGETAWLEERATALTDPATGQLRVAGLVWDISERKRVEEMLRAAQAQQSFLLMLSDTVRSLSSAAQILNVSVEMFGHHLGVAAVQYGIVGSDGNTIQWAATYGTGRAPGSLEQWPEGLQRGEELFSDELTGVPLMRAGQLVAILSTTSGEPRQWTHTERVLHRDVAERTWSAVERVQAEAAQRESQNRLRKAISIEAIGVLFFNLDGRIVEANQAFERMSGYTAEELRAIPHWEVLTPPDFAEVTAHAVEELATRGETAPYEKQMLKKDGSRWWGMCAPARIAGEGLQSECVEFVLEITDAKRREQNLAFLAEITEDLSRLSTAEEILTTVGAKTAAYLGAESCYYASIDEQRGEISPVISWRAGGVAEPQRSYALHDYLGGELLAAARSGRPVVVNDTAREPRTRGPLYEAAGIRSFMSIPHQRDGQLEHLLSLGAPEPCNWRPDQIEVFQEVAERIFPRVERARAEAARREAEVRMQAVENLVPDLLWSTNASGVTDWCNERWLEYTGQPLEQALTTGRFDAVHPDDRASAQRAVEDALQSGEPQRFEQRLRSGSGSYRWFLVQLQPVRDTRGTIVRSFGAATDIHEDRMAREMLEQRVQERTRELESLSVSRQHLLERLVSAGEEERKRIARELHDEMGQHLTALKVSLEGLQPETDPVRHMKQIVGSLDESVDRLTLELRPPTLDDLGLSGAIGSLIEQFTAASGIRADVHTPGSDGARLPEPVETTLYRVLQEALTNVWKHSGAKNVSVILERGPEQAQLIIEDDGQGFDDADEDGARGRFGLLGIRERVSLIGGTFNIESARGRGTTLYVRVPLPAL
jgi:two-component system, chemotaxis family, CheB/CheR fusion protein